MSSIIACSSPGTSGASGTRCGVLPRSLMPSAWASRLAGSMVSTTTVRPYSAARNAIAAAVVVLPTPPAPQHTTTRLEVSARIAPMSRAGGVVLIEPPAGQALRRARRGCRGRRRRGSCGSSSRDTFELVELLGALGARGDPRRVLDGLGEQAGEVAVGQLDPGARPARRAPRRRRCRPRRLWPDRRAEVGRDVAVDDDAADRQPQLLQFVDRLERSPGSAAPPAA